jgi:cyclase
MVEQLSECGFTPITVGGGVRSVRDVYDLLRAGADKVAICTAGFDDQYLLNAIAQRFGSQCLVLALDYRHGRIVTHCGTRAHDTRPGMGVVTQAIASAQLGVGEILLTSVDREGTMTGYDLVMIKAVSEAVDIPVIAHGGAGTYQHMLEALQAGAHAVAAGAMFQFTDQTPEGAAQYLAAHGVTTRTKEEA